MLTERPFRLGVLTKGTPTRAAWLDLLARVEDGGFDSLLMPTHSTPQFSVSAALADAAARTALTLGTLVVNNDLQHPVMLARDAATLSLLSGGRFELGIGAGWMTRDYAQLSLPMAAGAIRAARLAEAVSIIRSCCRGSAFSFHGTHYDVRDVTGTAVEPVPLMIGAGGPRMLALAVELADIVSISRNLAAGDSVHDIALDATLECTVRKVETLDRHIGDRRAEPELNILAHRVAIGPDSAVRVEQEAAAAGLTVRQVLDTPENFFASSVAEMAERLYERRAATGISYYVVRDLDMGQCRPLVAALAAAGQLTRR